MFTFSKKDAKALVGKSALVQNSILKDAILNIDSEIVGGINGIGYSQVVYDRIIHTRHVND